MECEKVTPIGNSHLPDSYRSCQLQVVLFVHDSDCTFNNVSVIASTYMQTDSYDWDWQLVSDVLVHSIEI